MRSRTGSTTTATGTSTIILGWNFIDGNNFPFDDIGHGTQVAFTVAGVRDNGEGGSGVAPDVRIMALRVIDDFQGFGTPVVAPEQLATCHHLRSRGTVRGSSTSVHGWDRERSAASGDADRVA